MKILIAGALGYMGREVAAQARANGIEVACGVDIAPGTADFPMYTTFEDCPPVDVIVDFSTWKPGADLLTYALKHRIPAVIATTGLTEEQLEENVDEYAVIENGTLDVDEAIREELLLSFPMRVLCSEECLGLCPKCGKPKRLGDCGCPTFEPDPRLAILKTLFDKNEEENQ